MMSFWQNKEVYGNMLRLSLLQHLGRRFYLFPLAVLVWPIYQTVRMLESGQVRFYPADAQNELIGFPLYILAIGIGIRIIASEIEHRTLEVAYTVPNGTGKIWRWKILSSLVVLVVTTLILAVITWAFFTPYSPGVLYRVLQGAMFFLVLSMSAGALLKSELAAALVSGFILFTLYPGYSGVRWSPIFDPLHSDIVGATEVNSWLIQNHAWVLIVTLFMALYAFYTVEQSDKFLR